MKNTMCPDLDWQLAWAAKVFGSLVAKASQGLRGYPRPKESRRLCRALCQPLSSRVRKYSRTIFTSLVCVLFGGVSKMMPDHLAKAAPCYGS